MTSYSYAEGGKLFCDDINNKQIMEMERSKTLKKAIY